MLSTPLTPLIMGEERVLTASAHTLQRGGREGILYQLPPYEVGQRGSILYQLYPYKGGQGG